MFANGKASSENKLETTQRMPEERQWEDRPGVEWASLPPQEHNIAAVMVWGFISIGLHKLCEVVARTKLCIRSNIHPAPWV